MSKVEFRLKSQGLEKITFRSIHTLPKGLKTAIDPKADIKKRRVDFRF
jgi:hypothetical protein